METATVRSIRAAPKARRSRPATLTPGMRLGAWRVESELGRGGMATVYAVVHTRFGKRAALKLAHREILDAKFTPETFLREAKTVNRIEHDSVIDVFATGTFDGRPYLVMERLAGETLAARLARGPLPRTEAIDLLLQLCDVLRAAHASGVVHRDLKLENLFVLPGGRLKLLDWGVAHVDGEVDPLTDMVAGTLTYVAPEQLRGDAITAAADVYSLGVLASQLLAGRAPFTATSDLELCRMHLQDPPPVLDEPELAALVTAMLAKHGWARPTLEVTCAALRRLRDPVAPVRATSRRPGAVIDPLGRPQITLPNLLRHKLVRAVVVVAMLTVSFATLI
jgi:serine/threonine protein kinase